MPSSLGTCAGEKPERKGGDSLSASTQQNRRKANEGASSAEIQDMPQGWRGSRFLTEACGVLGWRGCRVGINMNFPSSG